MVDDWGQCTRRGQMGQLCSGEPRCAVWNPAGRFDTGSRPSYNATVWPGSVACLLMGRGIWAG